MAKKLTQRQLSELRAEYLQKREELLINKVDALGVKLFDKLYNSYLANLEQNDGKLVSNDRNINIVKGIDAIYDNFIKADHIPVVKGFVKDLHGIVPLNERYFENIAGRDVRQSVIKVQAVVNKRLGVNGDGIVTEGGFVDKFIRDKTLLKSIKQETTKALTNKMGFQEFRVKLRESIQGNPGQQLSGGLQQYYRNFAYDTYIRVDRLNQDIFAKDLGLRYFIWSGGVINTSRPLCTFCNGKIVDAQGPFADLEYGDIKDTPAPNGSGKMQPFNSGLDEDWDPLLDLGQYACRHRKDFILDSVAERLRDRWLNVDDLV